MTTAHRRATATAVALAALAAGLAGAGPATAAPTCPELTPYAQATFSNPTKIDNAWFPLTPGHRLVLEGTVTNDQGNPEPHRVSFTVTDVTKVVNGVRTVVVWDLDLHSGTGQTQETELAFFAQDDAGNVWNFGEYPEEYFGGTFGGAPSTWMVPFKEAQAGIHMAANPVVSTPSNYFYLQGFAPSIEFEDCARVHRIGDPVTVPAGTFDNSLLTREKDAFDPAGGIQTKTHVQGIGIVKIGAIGDPLNERLELVSHGPIGEAALAEARVTALELDRRAYTFGDIYANTEPAQGPPAPPVEQPVVQTPPQPPARPGPPVVTLRLATLTLTRATATVRRALRGRLRDWRIASVKCKRGSRTRVTCTFVATTKRRSRASGTATVTMRGAERLVRYSIAARVVKGGCRPVASRSCTRRAVWRSR